MGEHVTIYERIHFDAQGEAVRWERSFDRQNWELVSDIFVPFILIKPAILPGVVEREIWKERASERP